jgi:excisionase family DNA binding protein
LKRPSAPAIIACFAATLSLGASLFAQSPAAPDVLDLNEAAALLRVTPEIVRGLAESHRIPTRRVGEEWRFWRSALLEWLKGDDPAAPVAAALRGAEPLGQRELADVTARGLTPPTTQAQAAQPASQAPAATPTVGERPSTPTSEEVALRDQRVLLPKGAATLDFGASYGRTEHSLFPVVRTEDKAVSMNATLRYSLIDDLQLTARVPTTWRRTTTFSDATVSGTTSARTAITPGGFTGDASISLLGVASHEGVGRPTIVWTVNGVLPTGGSDRGLGGGLVFSKSYDPAVLFAGLTYVYGFHTGNQDVISSLARHNFGAQVGYAYAINDTLALTTSFGGTYRDTRSIDGTSIPAARENYALQLGTTWLLSKDLFMEPSVAIGIGSDNPGLTLSLNFSRAFRFLSKR